MAPQPQIESEDLDTTHLLSDYPESSSASEVLSSPTDNTMARSKAYRQPTLPLLRRSPSPPTPILLHLATSPLPQ